MKRFWSINFEEKLVKWPIEVAGLGRESSSQRDAEISLEQRKEAQKYSELRSKGF